MREYLNLEFRDIEPILSFTYSLERVIDDFILLAVFVGNDFLPNLPDLHIHENGLERLFDVYKKILPSLGNRTVLHIFASVVNSYVSRWVHQRERDDQYEATPGCSRRDGALGAGGV